MGKFPKKVQGWQCKICEEVYDDEMDAKDCCEEEKQEEVTLWECIICGEQYEEKYDAYSCCE